MITGPAIVRDGLVFDYDADDRSTRFYKGEPTTNYIYNHNARIDSSYDALDLSSFGGTMVANHPGAIYPYRPTGSRHLRFIIMVVLLILQMLIMLTGFMIRF